MNFDPRTITADELFDPSISEADLASVASVRPDLWVTIVAHPKAYPALREWIAEQQAVRGATDQQATNGAAEQQGSRPSVTPGKAQVASEPQSTSAARAAVALQQTSAPQQDSTEGAGRGSRRRGLLIVAVVAVLALVAAGGWFWARSNAQNSFQHSVDELSSSVTTAEDAAREARETLAAYASELTRTGTEDKQRLRDTAQQHVDALNRSLERAKKVVPKARRAEKSGGKVPDSLRSEVRNATAQVDEAVDRVKRDLPKIKGERKRLVALPTKVPEMNLDQIKKGDFSSIQGVWSYRGKDRSDGYIEVSGNTIKWFYKGETEPGITFRGLDVEYQRYAAVGENGEMHTVHDTIKPDSGPGWVSFYVDVSWEDGSHPNAEVLGFYERGKTIDNLRRYSDVAQQPVPSDTSVDRILLGDGVAARLGYIDYTQSVVTREKAGVAQSGPKPGDSSSPAPTPSSASTCQAPIPGAYPCAGQKSIPAEAKELQVFHTYYGNSPYVVFGTPSGKLNCSIDTQEGLDCLQSDWTASTAHLPSGFIDGQIVGTVDPQGKSNFGVMGDTPDWAGMIMQSKQQVLPYGSVWKYEDWVVASSEQGLTVWRTLTGHGALVNSTGIHTF